MPVLHDREPPAPEVAVTSAALAPRRSLTRTLLAYASIARPDHWVKNVFMGLGVVLAYFCHPDLFGISTIWVILWAVAATCLLASSNYVLNEILDSPTDRAHPSKRKRPIPSGLVWLPAAYAEWILLGVAGLTMAWFLNLPFFLSGLFLLVMGVIYNVPPVRSKEVVYLDVLSESVNNPIRLLLGWFAIASTEFPPASLLLAYWFIGAFFMASKRFAEYRSIADPATAGAYRSSFRYYNEQKLMVSMFFYVTCFALFLGIFIIRYHLELVLIMPLVAGFVSYYLSIAYKTNSAAQAPEHLYREKWLVVYLVVCVVAFAALMFVEIPVLYDLFNVTPSKTPTLWKL